MTGTELEILKANEQAVIGGALNNSYLPSLIDLLPHQLLDYRARITWQVLQTLEAQRRPVDLITAETEITKGIVVREGHSDEWVLSYLADCAMHIPDVDTARDHARSLVDSWYSRECLNTLGEALELGNSRTLTGDELITRTIEALRSVQESSGRGKGRWVNELLKARMCAIVEEYDRKASGSDARNAAALPSGIESLDAKIGGFPIGQLTIVGGRPGMGKSIFGLTITHNVTSKGLGGVHVFSLEDTEETYANRLLARISGVDVTKFSSLEFNHGDFANIKDSERNVATKKPWIVDSTSGLTADDICMRVARHATELGTKLVVVDYLQLLAHPPWMLRTPAHERLGAAIQALVHMAKRQKVAVVLIAQVNRSVDQRDDKRPSQSDFKDTGSIEEKAKLLIALYRGDYYKDAGSKPDEIEMHILKFSHGETGVAIGKWDGAIARIQ